MVFIRILLQMEGSSKQRMSLEQEFLIKCLLFTWLDSNLQFAYEKCNTHIALKSANNKGQHYKNVQLSIRLIKEKIIKH